MRVPRFLLLLIAIGATGAVLAQTAPLPKALSGRWTTIDPGGKTFTDTISMVFDEPVSAGSVTGRLTVRGVACGAQDEPMTGIWDGTRLHVESMVRPNVNAQRMNGDCATGRLIMDFSRMPGQAGFEGEGKRDGSPYPLQLTLSP